MLRVELALHLRLSNLLEELACTMHPFAEGFITRVNEATQAALVQFSAKNLCVFHMSRLHRRLGSFGHPQGGMTGRPSRFSRP